MEILFGIFVVVAILIVAVGWANSIDSKSSTHADRAETDRIKAEEQRDFQRIENEIALNERAELNALMAVRRQTEVKQLLIESDKSNRDTMLTEARTLGDISFSVEIEVINQQSVPVVAWKWNSFGNAILKIHRNQGTILETPEDIKQHAPLIYLVEDQLEGRVEDKETQAGATYNYYAFAETLRTGYRPKEIKRNIPAELGEVIDQQGNRVETEISYEPEPYQEHLYFGITYKRVSVDHAPNPFAEKQRELDERRTALQMKEMEINLAEQEAEHGLMGSGAQSASESIENMLAQAVSKGKQKVEIKQLIANKIHNNTELSDDEKDELIEEINRKFDL